MGHRAALGDDHRQRRTALRRLRHRRELRPRGRAGRVAGEVRAGARRARGRLTLQVLAGLAALEAPGPSGSRLAMWVGDHVEADVAVDAVVDRQRRRRRDLAHEVDGLAHLEPRRADRREQDVDGAAGRGQRVARVVDAGAAGLQDVAGVVEAVVVGVDHRVLLAHDLDRRARDLEPVTGTYDRDALGDLGGLLAQQALDRGDRPDRHVGAAEVVGMDVVGVLVGDQDGVRTVQRTGVGEHPGSSDDDAAVGLDPHAGMAELGDPHAVQTRPVESETQVGCVVRVGLASDGWSALGEHAIRTRDEESSHVCTPRARRQRRRAATARVPAPEHRDRLGHRLRGDAASTSVTKKAGQKISLEVLPQIVQQGGGTASADSAKAAVTATIKPVKVGRKVVLEQLNGHLVEEGRHRQAGQGRPRRVLRAGLQERPAADLPRHRGEVQGPQVDHQRRPPTPRAG